MTEDEERRFSPAASFSNVFNDRETFISSLPGGKFEIVPDRERRFRGTIGVVNMAGGVSIRAMAALEPILMRTEMIGGRTPAISYFFPTAREPKAAVDGVHLTGTTVFSRGHGDTPTLKTASAFEIGSVCILHESLRRASAALTGRENARMLLAPASTRQTDASRLAALHARYFETCRAVETPHWRELSENPLLLAFIREEITSSLVQLLDTGDLRADHRAHQLQTASMRRIDRLIDEHSGGLIGMQDLCEKADLSLRTVEYIIRRRMGMTAHAYFQRRRLAFARKALINPVDGASVTRIALDHGFAHLGRFSVLYRKVYGESPSRTLRDVAGLDRNEAAPAPDQAASAFL